MARQQCLADSLSFFPPCLIDVVQQYAELTFEDRLNLAFPQSFGYITAPYPQEGYLLFTRFEDLVHCDVEYAIPQLEMRHFCLAALVSWPDFVRAAETRSLLSLFWSTPYLVPPFDDLLHAKCAPW
jgi:hypothetical protein